MPRARPQAKATTRPQQWLKASPPAAANGFLSADPGPSPRCGNFSARALSVRGSFHQALAVSLCCSRVAAWPLCPAHRLAAASTKLLAVSVPALHACPFACTLQPWSRQRLTARLGGSLPRTLKGPRGKVPHLRVVPGAAPALAKAGVGGHFTRATRSIIS